MQKPSVGRIVHYQSHEAPVPWAALVTAVNDDESVELTVFKPRTLPGYLGGPAPFAETPTPGHWNWPPRA